METAPPLREQLARARQKRAAIARRAPGAFIEMVLRDAQGRPYVMAPMHYEFHKLASRHKRLVLMAHFESGKTEQVSIGRTLWELGQDPSLPFAIVGKAADQATKTVRRIREIIETSAELHAVFPYLGRGYPWGDSAFSVARPHGARTPSVQAFGIDTAILSDRVDRMILDDVVDWESTRTEVQRKATVDKTLNHLLTRLTDRARLICIGTPFHVEDVLHVLGHLPEWALARFQVQDAAGNPRWPARWPPSRIQEVRATLGPATSARMLDLNAVSNADACFVESDITHAIQRGERAVALSHAEGYGTALLNKSAAYTIVLGVDPAISVKPGADLSAITAILIHPSGDREVLAVDAGRWPFGSLIDHIDRMCLRFGADVLGIETVQAQDWLAQAVLGSNRAIKVLRHQTGRGAMSLAWRIEQLGRELRDAKWIIPSVAGKVRDPDVAALVRDMSLMTRADPHVPDRVVSLLMAAYAAAESGDRFQAERGHLDLMTR